MASVSLRGSVRKRGHGAASIHRKQCLIKQIPIEMCNFWRVIFQVIEGVCVFLKSRGIKDLFSLRSFEAG